MQNCTKKNSYLDAPSKEIITTSGTYVLLLFLLFPRGTDRRNEMHASFTFLPQLQKALLTPYENANKKGLAQTNHKNIA